MPRPSKGPRLVLWKRPGRRTMWVIRDGERNAGTGCNELDRDGAEKALAQYIIKKHDPKKALSASDVNSIKIADVCSLEILHISKRNIDQKYKAALITAIQNLGNWFGDRVIGDLTADLQEQYAQERIYQAAAFHDLKLLAAAINRCVKKTKGGIQPKFSPTLPPAPESRERWLTRDEAARMLWAAWRARKATKLPGSKGRRTLRHIARYILVGIFKRKPDNKEATSKKQPTIPLPPRLLAHMRRWKRLGISDHSVIEWLGKRVHRVHAGWESAVELAGLQTDDKRKKVLRHTLRHTAITWYLSPDRRTGKRVDIETVSQYCGVSVETIRKTYRHETPETFDDLLNVSRASVSDTVSDTGAKQKAVRI